MNISFINFSKVGFVSFLCYYERMDVKKLHNKFPAATTYLSQILLIERDYTKVTNLRLSVRLGVSKPAVTQSIKRLKALGLVEQDLYYEILLSSEGREIAVEILKRHYLIEHVLVDLLGYAWDKSDREAKMLQSIVSDEFIEHVYKKMNYPDTCPHGNPFPGSLREKELIHAPRLTHASTGTKVTLLRITEEGEDTNGLLKFCFNHNLKPGTVLTLHKRDNENLYMSTDGDSIPVPLSYARYFCYSKF